MEGAASAACVMSLVSACVPIPARLIVLLALAAILVSPASRANSPYTVALTRAAELARDAHTQQAIEALQTLTRTHPDRPEAFNNLAVLYARNGELERARDLLAQAMNTHPSYAISYRNLNEVLAQLAARAYDRALDTQLGAKRRPQLALIDQAPELALAQPSAAPATATPGAPPVSGTFATSPVTTQPPGATKPQVPVVVAAAAPPQEKTQPAGSTPTRSATAVENAVLAAVKSWAKAWSQQDVKRYLEHYDAEFRPAGGRSRSDWESLRKVRVTRPQFIEVQVNRPDVRLESDGIAIVRFKQRYRSDTLDSTVTKELRLKRSARRWKILEERV